MLPFFVVAAALVALPGALGHASIFHPSMYGFNVTFNTFPYDNRPVSPLADFTFDQWWFHGHIDHPPNAGDFFELPAGGIATTEIACNKGATSFFASSDGGDIRNLANPDDPCPGSPPSEYHTNGPDDLKGCALAIAYKSDVTQVQPEDFVVFSVNQTCVFHRNTDFSVPAQMPACPDDGCHCAWFWIHSPDSGSEQNYMNGFKCKVTGATSNVALATPQLPRRCGADPANKVNQATPGNCTYGAKAPFYWFQKERNNMNEGPFSPPEYTDMYNFVQGAQNDIFQDSYQFPLPVPSADQKSVPKFLKSGSVNTTNTNGQRADEVSKFFANGQVPTISRGTTPPGPSNTAEAQNKAATSPSSTTSSATSTSTSSSSTSQSAAGATNAAGTTTQTVVQTVVVTATSIVTATATKARRALDAYDSSAAAPSIRNPSSALALFATLICTTYLATAFW